MLRQNLILAGISICMWGASTLFFILFGDWLLASVEEPRFGSSLFLLEALTILVLIGIAVVVRLRLFREPGSATRLGFLATTIGLLLNTFVVLYRHKVYPDLDDGQFQAFTIWMTLAYAFFLLVPAVVDRLIRTKNKDSKESLNEYEEIPAEHHEL